MGRNNRKEIFYRLHEVINLIDNNQFEKAITALNGAILPVDDITDNEEQRLVERSNSFINGAIKNLKALPELPLKNMYAEMLSPSPEYYERSKKIEMAKECIRTVIHAPRDPNKKEIDNKINAMENRLRIEILKGQLSQNEQTIDILESISELNSPSGTETKKGEGPDVGDIIGIEKTDNRIKMSQYLFEKEILPKIFDYFTAGERTWTNKKEVFKHIAKSYEFGGSTIEKRYRDYLHKPHGKLIPALKKYGNSHLIEDINRLR